MRKLLLLAGMALIVAALFVVQLPLLQVTPGDALRVSEQVELHPSGQDIDIGEINGELVLATVRLEAPTAVEALEVLFDDTDQLVARRSVVPPDIDPDQFRRQQQRRFRESARVAAAVAQRAAGLDVTVSGEGARVVGVLPRSPADGTLEGGDVILEIGGREISLASDVGAAIADASAGDEVELLVERDGERTDVTIALEELAELGQAGLGVALETVDQDIQLPVEVDVTNKEIGGPSGGLMLAVTIYDLIAEDDVADGRVIAGTGTIDPEGRVGPISGIEQKVDGARRAGADILLVAADQAEAARSAAGSDLEVIGVDSFDDALQALEGGTSS